MAETVQKLGVKREAGWLYFLRGSDVWRAPMARSGGPAVGGKAHKVASGNFRREEGYLYFLDAKGDVARARRREVAAPKKTATAATSEPAAPYAVGAVYVNYDRNGDERGRLTVVRGTDGGIAFEYNGNQYKSPSAAAMAHSADLGLSSTSINGLVWWGIKTRGAASSAASPRSSVAQESPRDSRRLSSRDRRLALEALSRDRLASLAAAYGLEVADRRMTASYVDAIVRARSLDFAQLLRSLKSDELLAICTALDIGTVGRKKADLAESILLSAEPPDLDEAVRFVDIDRLDRTDADGRKVFEEAEKRGLRTRGEILAVCHEMFDATCGRRVAVQISNYLFVKGALDTMEADASTGTETPEEGAAEDEQAAAEEEGLGDVEEIEAATDAVDEVDAREAPPPEPARLAFERTSAAASGPLGQALAPAIAPASGSLIGRTLGNWRIQRQLGAGSFGAVYEAQHVHVTGRRGAVKVLHAHLSVEPSIKQRFLNEASAASLVDHENIVMVFDGGNTEDGLCYSVAELLRGATLAEVIAQGPLGIARAINVGIQVASALEAAHAANIVHRDLKPDNIFIVERATNREFVKVLDFGIAKLLDDASGGGLTSTGSWLGTPHYMSPEQWQALPDIDGRADIYSLGIILYECLTGILPFSGRSTAEWYEAHIRQEVPIDVLRERVGAEPAGLVRMMLEKDRDRRFKTMLAVKGALKALRDSLPPTEA